MLLSQLSKMKVKLRWILQEAEAKFEKQFGFKAPDSSFSNVVRYLHLPKDPSSLAITRMLFGLAMLFDIPDERGGAAMDQRWGDPKICYFPLIPFIHPTPMPYMALVYAGLWLGAVAIMLGFKYRAAAWVFAGCYWYLFLVEKSFWNNHSYLFGLVSLLLACTDAGGYWSLDAKLDPAKRRASVPYWNYFILKYQFFILYFMAGVKKGSAEWLAGYSVKNLSEHWVFAPFRLFLNVPQIDYLVVHWFIFVFDLTVAAWMMWGRTRHAAMLFCALFHLMNSRLFRIGMFPWVCLATMPLFYPFDWPKLTVQLVQKYYWLLKTKSNYKIFLCTLYRNVNIPSEEVGDLKDSNSKGVIHSENEVEVPAGTGDMKLKKELQEELENKNVVEHVTTDREDSEHKTKENGCCNFNESEKSACVKNCTVFLIIFHIVTQAFLPFSHFITKGFNNWTDGLYGYSWDMMVHTWDGHSVIVKVVDNEKNKEFYVDPFMFTLNDRWSRHGDMVYQYARCLKNKIIDSPKTKVHMSRNISIYIDVWCSMNGRFAQRMFDPKVDMLKAEWSPLAPVPYLMPMLDEAIHWRRTLDQIREDVRSWGEFYDVTFFADFPGHNQEKFIPKELSNISLTILEGTVSFEPEVTTLHIGQSTKLVGGDRVDLSSGTFHKVINIGQSPAFYMYTFNNSTEVHSEPESNEPKPMLPLGKELKRRLNSMVKFGNLVFTGIFQILFGASKCVS